MLFKSHTKVISSWLKKLFQERKDYTSLQKKELKEAFGLFTVVHDRYTFHSENSLLTKPDKVSHYLSLYYKYEADFESICRTEKPTYTYAYHPLSELVLFAQFAWFYYELPNSKALLEKMWQLISELHTSNGLVIFHTKQLRSLQFNILGEDNLYDAYISPYYASKILFYLAEIAELEGHWEKAVIYYQQFMLIENDFSPRCDFKKDEYYYYLRSYLPNVPEAWKRIGKVYLREGMRLKAKNCFEYALKFPYTQFSPFFELADMMDEVGRYHEAFHLRMDYLSTLLTYRNIPLDFEAYFLLSREIGAKYKLLLGQQNCEEITFHYILRYYQKEAQNFEYFTYIPNQAPKFPNTSYLAKEFNLIEKSLKEMDNPHLYHIFESFSFELILFARNLTSTQKIEKLKPILEKWLKDARLQDFENAIQALFEYYPNQVEYDYKKNYPFKDEADVFVFKELAEDMTNNYRNNLLLGIVKALQTQDTLK